MARKKTEAVENSVSDTDTQILEKDNSAPLVDDNQQSSLGAVDELQSMSLEDAIAVSEMAANDLMKNTDLPKPKKSKASKKEQEPEEITAVYNPDLLIADIAAETKEEVDNLESVDDSSTADVVSSDITINNPDEQILNVASLDMAVSDISDEPFVTESPVEESNQQVQSTENLADTTVQEKQKPVKTPTKKTVEKKSSPKPKTVKEKPVEETVFPVPVANETVVSSLNEDTGDADIEKNKSSKKKKQSSKKTTDSDKKEEANVVAEAKEEKPSKATKKRKKSIVDPSKNFKLLKALIILLALFSTCISAHIFYAYIYDAATAFSIYKLIPIIPFAFQVLLLFISLITVGTSKRRPIGAAIKENIKENKEYKQEIKEQAEIKEMKDNLLVPEIVISNKKSFELTNYQLDSFYKKNIEEINGKYYMQVTKFDDNARAFEALGATDMELCAVNMIGSAKFTEILDQPRAKTLNTEDLIKYFLSKPSTFAIKKRGAIDWTFKYNSKSFGIIRENDESYKVSIKCYPDAATKVNEVYKALEDSNFPSGPLWYCFNELRNLPPRVCKWLIDTSCQISRFQQIKTNKMKDEFKTAKDYDISMEDIAAKFKAGEKIITFPKFAIVFSKGEDADLTTYLTREIDGIDASSYTKEYYYKFSSSDDAISILCPTKGVSEEIVIAIFDEIENILK